MRRSGRLAEKAVMAIRATPTTKTVSNMCLGSSVRNACVLINLARRPTAVSNSSTKNSPVPRSCVSLMPPSAWIIAWVARFWLARS